MPRRTRRWCGGTEFIPAHAAFGYLARRYGVRVIAVSGLTPEAEPSASRVKEVVRQARRAGIRGVFVEPLGGRGGGGGGGAGGGGWCAGRAAPAAGWASASRWGSGGWRRRSPGRWAAPRRCSTRWRV